MTEVTNAVATTDYFGPNESKKARDYRKRLAALEEEAQPYFTPWQDAANHFMPGSVRISTRGTNTNRTLNPLPDPDIVNGVGVLARRIFESGMMASLTNPLRPWCAIGTIDPDVNKSQRAKMWYHQAVEWMFGVLAGGNAYQVLPKIYGTLGTHGTSGNIQEPDEKDTVRLYN